MFFQSVSVHAYQEKSVVINSGRRTAIAANKSINEYSAPDEVALSGINVPETELASHPNNPVSSFHFALYPYNSQCISPWLAQYPIKIQSGCLSQPPSPVANQLGVICCSGNTPRYYTSLCHCLNGFPSGHRDIFDTFSSSPTGSPTARDRFSDNV